MESPKMQVRCGVNTCHYWKSDFCQANSLEVNPQGDGKALSSDGTCCTTFKPQE